MMTTYKSIAVVGAGIAGATAARALAQAGHLVHIFDKARGPGGRLATRQVEWVDRQGHATTTRLDHGALCFTCSSSTFQNFADHALQSGCLAEWTPRLAAGTLPPGGGATLYVPAPDMPALCRDLLKGVPTHFSFTVDGLHRDPFGWQVQAGGLRHACRFDAVVLALPPAQAALLLGLHRLDWARHASIAPMQPCWTLMGIANEPATAVGWDLAQPPSGLLAWVLRNDMRPGRTRVPGQAHWIAHARASWSRQHLEQPAEWVQQQMQVALADCLGRSIDWHHCTAHRWRYALPQTNVIADAPSFWWDPAQGLGVCGDFLGGGGVEGAWQSAQALSAALLRPASDAARVPATPTAIATPEDARGHQAPSRLAA